MKKVFALVLSAIMILACVPATVTLLPAAILPVVLPAASMHMSSAFLSRRVSRPLIIKLPKSLPR